MARKMGREFLNGKMGQHTVEMVLFSKTISWYTGDFSNNNIEGYGTYVWSGRFKNIK